MLRDVVKPFKLTSSRIWWESVDAPAYFWDKPDDREAEVLETKIILLSVFGLLITMILKQSILSK
jgi:hypothetical protein